MHEYLKQSRRIIEGGNEILRFLSSYPNITGCEEISEFYATLSKNCEEWCAVTGAREIYERSSEHPPTKAVCKPPSYAFEVKVVEVSEKNIKLLMRIKFSDERVYGEAVFEEFHLWNLDTKQIIPSKNQKRIKKN